MTTGAFPVGAMARFDHVMDRADEALAALPKRAVTLLAALRSSGWGWVVGWSEDTGGNAFVTVKGKQSAAPGAPEINLTWHTRRRGSGPDTGTLRLFGCMIAPRQTSMYSRGWHDTSVTAAQLLVTDNPAPQPVG